ncbi:MAG: frdB [Deltaproteobacteria bacterium]|jgi:succinate dehydrogenase/fumarate reductase iron-sulfur protein|nr:frdB [Deltaproteobacteria bacterium]
MENKGIVTIFRFDPTVDKEPRYERYEVPYEYWHRVKVIDTLRYVYEVFDPGLSFREPCRQQICGACILFVNKKSVLACEAFSEKEMVIEPIPNRVVLKDLITESSSG